ncbi:SAM-dependent methyltransferase [Candidatus Woesearchaeota archaeon]|nr:SAM-dependent methyltransferase [Candidatus Woesearchaeota archaeon]
MNKNMLPAYQRIENPLKFIKEFLKHPVQTGAVAPSSSFLTKKMLEPVDFTEAKTIVELGPGEGTFTRAMLKRMRKDATLYAIEINPEFTKKLSKIKDKRLIVCQEDATKVKKILNGAKPDYIISGLPIGIMPDKVVRSIIKAVKEVLGNATFIQFQYTPRWHLMLARNFTIIIDFTPLNIPPALVYICTKKEPNTPPFIVRELEHVLNTLAVPPYSGATLRK